MAKERGRQHWKIENNRRAYIKRLMNISEAREFVRIVQVPIYSFCTYYPMEIHRLEHIYVRYI